MGSDFAVCAVVCRTTFVLMMVLDVIRSVHYIFRMHGVSVKSKLEKLTRWLLPW